MTTGKTIAVTRQTFVGKVMSLLFNMLSRLVKTFLPRSKRLLVSWLQSPSAVILEPPNIKPLTVSIVSPSICHEVMGPDAMISIFSSSILGTYLPGEFIFQYHIFLPFHTVHGILNGRILKWFAIPFSSGPHFFRTLHHDPHLR